MKYECEVCGCRHNSTTASKRTHLMYYSITHNKVGGDEWFWSKVRTIVKLNRTLPLEFFEYLRRCVARSELEELRHSSAGMDSTGILIEILVGISKI